MASYGISERQLLNASWLIKLRWVAVFGQLATIGGAIALFDLRIPMLWPLWVVIALTAVSNGIFQLIFGRLSNRPLQQQPPWDLLLGLLMVMDILSLTSLLFASGGPTNPFCLFFFVNLSLSALLLSRTWAWGLNLLTIGCFVTLVLSYFPLAELDLGLGMQPFARRQASFPDAVWGRFSLVQLGFIASFGTCSSVIVYFMTRLTDEIRQQEVDLRLVQERQSRVRKLEALGTLAAGAAHELATPLSTIAVVAGDAEAMLQREERNPSGNQELLDDIRLIRSELNRCRKILDTMSADAGQAVGERNRRIQVGDFWLELAEGCPENQRLKFHGDPETVALELEIPVIGLTHALRALVKNALDASAGNTVVDVFVERSQQQLIWRVVDRGPGMSVDVLERIREPFFTTKPPGQGMGLGVFLAQNILERVGGQIEFRSKPLSGTEVTVVMPLNANVLAEEQIDGS